MSAIFGRTNFSAVENMPFPVFMVSIHADTNSDMSTISYSGFSEITHDQASMPAETVAGPNASKGSSTK